MRRQLRRRGDWRAQVVLAVPKAGSQEKDTNSASWASPLSCPFLTPGSVPGSSITVHRSPQDASYGGGEDPTPCSPLAPSCCVDFTSPFMYFSFQWLSTPRRGSVNQHRGQLLTFKTSLACNFPFLPFVLIIKRTFLHNQRLFLRGQPYFNRMFLV